MTDTRRISNKQKAMDLYSQNINLSRKDFLTLLTKNLGIPENSARTYASNCAKELNNKLGLPFKTRKVNVENTKKAQAMKLFSENTTLSRADMIKKFEQELGMGGNSASTHCSLCVAEYAKAGGTNHNITYGRKK